MNSIPVLQSKLSVPELPQRVLDSGRLKALEIGSRRTTILTAPAGFGKTTAVLLSLRKKTGRIYWYRMEKEDSLLPVFYAHLIELLFPRDGEEVSDAARSFGSIGSISEEYPLLNAVICQSVWTRHQLDSAPFWLIFDDFQMVSDNPFLLETIRYFIANMPPQIRIIILSRTETGIRSGRLVLDADIHEITGESLRFTREETEKLAKEIFGFSMESEAIRQLQELSEGWIAGILMLCHTAGPSGPGLREILSAGADSRRDLFRYLLNEGFQKADHSLLRTLACISLLPDFTCSELTEILGLANAAEIVAEIERNNLYVTKTKTEVTRYQFHPLFRDALQSVLREVHTAGEIAEMQVRAARHFKEAGDIPRAVGFLLAAGREEEAVRLGADEGILFMDDGDTHGVSSILRVFPDSLVEAHPKLLFLRGASLMSIESDQSFEYLRRALTGFMKGRDLELQMRAVGLMISVAYEKNDLNNIKQVIALVPKFKAVISSKYARTTLLLSAFMNAAWADNLKLSGILYNIIERMNFHQPLWDYTYMMAKVMVIYRTGDLQQASRLMPVILNHPIARRNDRWKAIGLAVCHAVTSQQADIEGSQKLVGELVSIGEKYGSDYALGYGLRLSAYIKYQERDPAGAASAMEKSTSVFARNRNPIMTRVGNIIHCFWKAETEPAGPLADRAMTELQELQLLKPGQGFLEHCQVIAGALYKETQDTGTAERLLLQGYQASLKKKALQSLCGAAMHLADLYYRKGASDLEEKYLKVWGDTCAEHGYIYFREMNYSTLVRVCARCAEKGIHSGLIYKIITRYFGPESAGRLMENPASISADPAVFIKETTVRSHREKNIRVKLFGSFQMAVDGTVIGDNEWKTRKIRGILKYILANPDRPVSREYLASVFWPESDAKAASTSLRAALYELRKILARYGLAFESSDALIMESNNSFQLCGKDRLDTDTERFAAIYKKYKASGASPEETRSLLSQMVELYKGDFLEDDPYDEWSAVSREHYRSIFIEAAHRLAEIHLNGRESEPAEALLERLMKADPYDATACGMLLKVYEASGQQARALSLRRQFEKRYFNEMGVKPEL